jgi:hypothetical protein
MSQLSQRPWYDDPRYDRYRWELTEGEPPPAAAIGTRDQGGHYLHPSVIARRAADARIARQRARKGGAR